MRIKNTTKWDTEDLRKLFGRCIREIKRLEGRGTSKGLQVEVRNRRGNWISGRATIGSSIYKGGKWILIGIGRKVDFRDAHQVKQLAKLFIHEFYHTLGYRSQDYGNYKYDWTKRVPTRFVRDYDIREVIRKSKPKRDLRAERYQKILKKVKYWEKKNKLAKTYLKKYKQKQKYYERKIAKSR